ncbi:hypothetical protein [Synoicihabitans lomoniglobus]|uniref:Uncharacterized protein n=1 Tax=Synoicihabitans lomoniglobus TaxID=2909285 RepID=A0AAE9ZYF8_9BACT|nr:hypothetical protein [Opitutaceae bacterium LMO-M01]WED65350.1 hypothetical protein PXH66_00620 [Opitutaceae bacterium LMO-M01]
MGDSQLQVTAGPIRTRKSNRFSQQWLGGRWRSALVCLAVGLLTASEAVAETPANAVTYEAFGAVGDGVTDDLPAICEAHAYANTHGLPVRSNPDATYHLGRRALTAVIETNTTWSTSRFIIDDSQTVENHKRSLFEVRSRLQPVPLAIDRLTRGQDRLDVRPATDCLVWVENEDRRIFIRRGLNQNNGTAQQEVFILRRDGSIEGAIDWDYDTVTQVEARPIDPEPLVVQGGRFINIANRMRQEVGYNYWARNIAITRSNTEIVGLVHEVVGETDIGHPYRGFLSVERCANITLRDCSIDARKTYQTIGSAGKPVPMGSYGYHASFVVNFRMLGCRSNDILDRTRWGVVATNFMKNILVEDCELSRMDVHMGASGDYIIRRSTLGYMGLNAIGRGRLRIEESTLHGDSLVSFRSDYGSTWQGELLIRDSRWLPRADLGGNLSMFHMNNDGTHDFGYTCSMPELIRIEGLFVDDSGLESNEIGMAFFNDPIGPPRAERPFPYLLTKRLEISDLTTARGLPRRVSDNPALVEAITVVAAPDVVAAGASDRPTPPTDES